MPHILIGKDCAFIISVKWRMRRQFPFFETVLYADEHLIVADKPHFLPVTPAGQFVEETLLTRLIRRFDNPHLVPLHRIDRHTARARAVFRQSRQSHGVSGVVSRAKNREAVRRDCPCVATAEFSAATKDTHGRR